MVRVRLATLNDIDELVRMRWDFSEEERVSESDHSDFFRTCGEFLTQAIHGGDWFIWVAEAEGKLVSHMYLQLIHKVPRPGKSKDPYFGYVTNVYTRPLYRNKGIGTMIHQVMEQWSRENNVEFLILWPSSNSVQFYTRNQFVKSQEAMEKHF
ncbi:N-acetyltransferase family protein [Brevibacillus sp. NRS-1366]|uniref:GNAT family N-acetyltransferase n=1 Tax=Brevibacillus sp. NRS-1366 TaxID=3233899 RepID=UPI003D1D7087